MLLENYAMRKLEELEDSPSTKQKIVILKEALDNPGFARIVKMALDPLKKYKINKIEFPSHIGEEYTMDQVLDVLEKLPDKRGLSDEERKKISLMMTNRNIWRIASRIVQKDLKCGVDIKLVNKAKSEMVELMPYQRCSTQSKLKNIRYPASLEVKADGMFVNVIVKWDTITFKTRNGKILPVKNEIILDGIDDFAGCDSSYVFMGEMLVKVNDKILPRKTGNGILNSMISGKHIDEYQENLVFVVWDMIPYDDFKKGKCSLTYEERVSDLHEMENQCIKVIEKTIVDSEESVWEIAYKWISEGKEGGVLKNLKSTWENKTCTEWIKIKSEKECELVIVGWNYAEEGSKFDGLMGSVICESSCGGLRVNISGWNDKERSWDWDSHIGQIITVRFNEVIQSKGKKESSLFLPRVIRDANAEFVEFRYDKKQADDLEYILSL